MSARTFKARQANAINAFPASTLPDAELGLSYLAVRSALFISQPARLDLAQSLLVHPTLHRCLLITSLLSILLSLNNWATVRWRNGTWSVKRLTRKEWAQQIVVVTGGSRGMGKSIVDCMITKGAKVVSLDVLPAQDEAGIGHPTVLINNAGIQNNRLLIDLDDQEIDRMLNINLKSHFYTIQAFLPDMIRRGKGHVVLTSSVMGYVGVSQMSDYVATKHALVGLLESLRYELDKKHRVPKVRTSLVILGHVRTALFSGAQFGPLASFLAPTVEAEQVAQEITAAVERQESTHIALPFYANLVPWLKVVPTFLRDLAQWMGDADDSMPPPTPNARARARARSKGE
ncbi:Hydroxysteroid 17-beta dehydrogenase 11 [Ceraceosorus bombacis]|uniref:Hydroxysteroid 17-beta dehydrogenase 11 n=1 Tax=Ceraceosorus bombacis TaxID=401625 RepID=A0A0P1BDE7_9BASI|nr:Hydroxysteroid 17-beta dehydrogenase 11 [Ceraceosorus bombacis]